MHLVARTAALLGVLLVSPASLGGSEAAAAPGTDVIGIIGDLNAVGASTAPSEPVSGQLARSWSRARQRWESANDPLHDGDRNAGASPWPRVANRWLANGRNVDFVAAADSTSRLVRFFGAWDPNSLNSRYFRFRRQVASSGASLDAIVWIGGNHDVGQSHQDYQATLEALLDAIARDYPGVPVLIAPLTSKAHAATDPRWVAISRAQWDTIASRPNAHLGPNLDDGLAYEADGEAIHDVAELGDRLYHALWGRLHGRTYYVDAANGSDLNSGLGEADAWGAPVEPSDKANAVPQFGDTVLIKGDQPAFEASLSPVNSGHQGAPITYRGYGASLPTIHGVQGCCPAIRPAKASGPQDWLVFEDLILDQPASEPNGAVRGSYRDVPWRFFSFEDILARGGNGAGDNVWELARATAPTEHFTLRRVTLDPNPISNLDTDMIKSDARGSHFLLDRVTCTDGGHNCVQLYGERHFVTDSSFTNPDFRPFELSNPTGFTVRNDYTVIQNSRFAGGCGSNCGGAFQSDARRVILRGNILSTSGPNRAPIRPFASNPDRQPDTNGWRIYHNTVHGSGGMDANEGGINHGVNRTKAGDGDMAWLNNLLSGNGGFGGSKVQFFASFGNSELGSPIASSLQGNLLWAGAPGLDVIQVEGSHCGGLGQDRCTVAEAEAYFASVADNLEADPGFCDTTDFELSDASPAIDAGAWLTTVAALPADKRSVVVHDDLVFSDGNWNPVYSVPVAPGDSIQFEGGQEAVVLWIDRTTGTLWLDRRLSGVLVGDGVALPYAGARPDIGAVEHTAPTCGGSLVACPCFDADDLAGVPTFGTCRALPPTLNGYTQYQSWPNFSGEAWMYGCLFSSRYVPEVRQGLTPDEYDVCRETLIQAASDAGVPCSGF